MPDTGQPQDGPNGQPDPNGQPPNPYGQAQQPAGQPPNPYGQQQPPPPYGQQPQQPPYGQQPNPYGQAQQPPPYGQQPYGQPPQDPYGQPQYPPPPSYQQPMGGYGYPDAINTTNILVYGILSIFCCGIILGPVAIFQGVNALNSINSGRADPAQKGLVITGIVCGAIGTVGWLVRIIIFAASFASQSHSGL